MQDKSNILLDMTKNVEKLELGSIRNEDLMFIKCYATTEGKNLNGTYFSRRLLAQSYLTFIDKPLVIVPSYLGEPTGHGYDFINKRFKNDERKVVGHIIDSKLVIVPEPSTSSSDHEDEDLIVLTDEDISSGKFLVYKGELRVLCTVVVYQHYLNEVADIIRDLHSQNKLNFSMEGLMNATEGDDGTVYADDITFTGLAIVKNPAFVNSYSLEVAEILDNKGGAVMAETGKNQNMNQNNQGNQGNQNNKNSGQGSTVPKEKYDELLQKYNDLFEKYNALKKQGGSNSNSKQNNNNSNEMASKYTEALEEIAELKSQVEELVPFKERIETAEKLQVGKDRLERLSKLSKVDVTAEQLAEMSEAEYIEMLEKAVDAKKPATETAEEIDGVIFDHSAGGKSNKSILLDAIAELTKDE